MMLVNRLRAARVGVGCAGFSGEGCLEPHPPFPSHAANLLQPGGASGRREEEDSLMRFLETQKAGPRLALPAMTAAKSQALPKLCRSSRVREAPGHGWCSCNHFP